MSRSASPVGHLREAAAAASLLLLLLGRPAEGAPLRVRRLTRGTIMAEFQSVKEATRRVNLARQREWKPTEEWLRKENARYGQILIVNDLHVGPGRNPLTGKVHPVEGFLPDRQEPDMRNLLASVWEEQKQDHRVRTLVGNGDIFEFMQVTTAPAGERFRGPKDQYGPLNTPRTTLTKLREIRAGHASVFQTYAEHLARG